MAERRSIVPEGEGMFVFVFDPKPGGTRTLCPPTALCGVHTKSVSEGLHVEMWTLKGSILTWSFVRAPIRWSREQYLLFFFYRNIYHIFLSLWLMEHANMLNIMLMFYLLKVYHVNERSVNMLNTEFNTNPLFY